MLVKLQSMDKLPSISLGHDRFRSSYQAIYGQANLVTSCQINLAITLQGSIQDVRETSRFRILQVRYQRDAAVRAYTAFENQYALHPIRILFDGSRWYQISRQEASLPWLERVQQWGQLSLFSVAAPSLEDIYVETVVDVARRPQPVSAISRAGRNDG